MTQAPNGENADTPPLGAITYDPIEQYVVFVHQAEASQFTAAQPDWRVDWCVETVESPVIVQVV